MKWALTVVIALASVACTSRGLAEDNLETAKQFVEFWRPLEGSWEVTIEVEGVAPDHDADSFLWTFKKSPTGLCYVDEVRVNGEVTGHGIHGYDPQYKHWHLVSYGIPQTADERLHGTTWLFVDLTENMQLTEGISFIGEGKDVMPDGKVVNTRSRWQFPEVKPDRVVIRFTEATRNGEAMPDTTMTLRKKK